MWNRCRGRGGGRSRGMWWVVVATTQVDVSGGDWGPGPPRPIE